ncbi:Hsp70 family protein [Anaplasma capra]|uniref:Hsp70 family protein n=1 Tax=Anaplasma capra TaxID=1562740 RepID=UPI0021D57304|nr:Hsp70 family protein [Anaplasma capra]MCU7611622.1 Hsp70 family protein [Anaplasma capra]MCU7612230.1 Hsp70 family protein [Anaplasma capra]
MQLLDIVEPVIVEQGSVFGIDLGTTNSLIATVCPDGAVRIFDDPGGRSLVPSIVEYVGDMEVKVGHDADSRCALRSTKRLMGKLAGDVEGSFYGARITEVSGNLALAANECKVVTPVEVAAEVLRCLAELVKSSTGQDVKRAVITVPAYFDEAARKATRKAARLAGIEVMRLLNEPTASALAYKFEQTGDTETCVVYDFGGGTFDVSVLRLHDGVFQVLATGGDTYLGGDDIDALLAELVLAKYESCKRAKICDFADDRDFMVDACRAKEALSSGDDGTFEFRISGDVFKCDITHSEFSDIVDGVISKTMRILENTISDASLNFRDISRVILVGGSSRIPNIKAALDSIFPGRVFDSIDQERAVVIGAALQAYYLANPGATGRKVLVDVVPLSLSLEVMGGVVETIIPRNTPVPALVAQEFTTYTDGQTAISIHVCQGEREVVSENRSLAKFDIKVPPLPAGEARIGVEFRVDMDGLLVVSVQDKLTGSERCVEVHQLEGVTEADIERQVLGSVEHFDEDMAFRDLSARKLECARVIELLETELANKRFSEVEMQVINDMLSEARGLMHEGDAEKMRAFTKRFRERFVELGRRDDFLYEKE